jgi:hypothetical protein
LIYFDVSLTGSRDSLINGVALSEDLVRRFLVLELDPRTEDPESRPFEPGFLKSIAARRAELLSAALTIWRWGRLKEHAIPRGRPLGSYETWTRWVRDPLLALGCADPVERIAQIKARDPERQRKVAIFDAWWEENRGKPIAATQLSDRVRKLIDPDGKTRQHLAAAVSRLAGTRVGGYTAPCSAILGPLNLCAKFGVTVGGLAWQFAKHPGN